MYCICIDSASMKVIVVETVTENSNDGLFKRFWTDQIIKGNISMSEWYNL